MSVVRTNLILFTMLVLVLGHSGPRDVLGQWKPADGPLMTRWSKEVSPDNVHSEYPRPQLVRSQWLSLNGLWDYAIRPRAENQPTEFSGQILVPFPAESALSGVKRPVGEANRLWYRRSFQLDNPDPDRRWLLHFGAVDWEAVVWVNGQRVGEHRGGYAPFTFDITPAIRDQGEQEIVVTVWDPTDGSYQPRGKQVSEPRGIWYTSVTGIWQTVWLESVPTSSIEGLRIVPDVDNGSLKITVHGRGTNDSHTVKVAAKDGPRSVGTGSGRIGEMLTLSIDGPKLWSPDSPFLYGLEVVLQSDGNDVDKVTSYFGMRKIAVARDDRGVNRLFLNGKALFMFGPLDQGWWPDGLYTAPSDEALRYDVEATRQLGFNMARKHVKMEPARWYYHCDRLGLLVWQDMPSGDRYIGRNDPDIVRTTESAENFRREYKAMIDALYNHPCVVVWVPFNEGWGQFETDDILAWTKEYDPTRLVDAPSGWADRGSGDLSDVHRYPGPAMPATEPGRAAVLGEFGGLGLPLENHLWWNKRNWGYRTYESREQLQASYDQLMRNLRPLIGSGLAAAVYTQTSDVEGEVNGLMTYDRSVIKLDAQHVAALHRKMYLPPPTVIKRVLVPTSQDEGQRWRYTTEKPSPDWSEPKFDDSGWSVAEGGFGTQDTPGTHVRTRWNTSDIWLRRVFELPRADLAGLNLRIHHDEDATVYLNGTRVASLRGYQTDYVDVPLDAAAHSQLRLGRNTLAVHCHQTAGGQYIDVGLVDVIIKEQDEP